jgi:hypothetical protein
MKYKLVKSLISNLKKSVTGFVGYMENSIRGLMKARLYYG